MIAPYNRILPRAMSASIPSCDEANNLASRHANTDENEDRNTNTSTNSHAGTASIELPPAYAVVDEKATTFNIYGTFIYTPNGPAYQLSSLLDARIARLRIRRLHAEEVAIIQSGASHIPFDDSGVLYEAHDPPFRVNEYYIHGKESNCLPGVLQLRFGVKRWHVRHIARQGDTANDILSCGKRGTLSRALKQRKNEMEPSEWKDSEGYVLATEVLRMENGGKLPTIELKKDLDQTCRELLLALWVTRLWAAFGAGTSTM